MRWLIKLPVSYEDCRVMEEAPQISPFRADVLVNVSVLADIESLHTYAYLSAHIEFYG